jgi:hypothetical protein
VAGANASGAVETGVLGAEALGAPQAVRMALMTKISERALDTLRRFIVLSLGRKASYE